MEVKNVIVLYGDFTNYI